MAQMNTFIPTGVPTMAPPSASNNSGQTNTKNDNSTAHHARPSGLTSNDNEQDGGAEADSSANEGRASAEDDADAEALSGVARLTMEPKEHLAGENSSDALQDDDMMFLDDVDMMDSTQASEGADDLDAKDFEIDDDYTGLEAISDDDRSGEEIEKDMLKAAELDLRHEFLQYEASKTQEPESDWFAEELNEAGYRSRNLSIGSDDDDPFGLNAPLNLNEDPFEGAQLYDTQWQGLMNDAELNLWRMPHADRPREDSFNSNDRPKRVRFAEGAPLSRSSSRSSSGSSDDEDDNNNQYPDIFMDQDDPKIQQLLAQDHGDADMNGYGSDAGSVYDFEDDADRFAFEMDEESDSSEYDSDSELSDDSEDDGGYETEEEDPEEAKAKMQEVCKMARPPVTTASAPATPTQSKRTPAPVARSNSIGNGSTNKSNKNKKGPREGTFECDPTKATVVSDATGKKTVLYMPTQPSAQDKAFWERARSAANSQNTSPRGSMSITLPGRGGKEEQQARPFTAQSTLSTMFNGNFDFMPSNSVSPPPPARSSTAPLSSYTPTQSAYTTPAPTDVGSDADEDYPDFNMLVDLNQDSDDDDDGTWSAAVTSPTEPTFLSRGMVGSFRLNQHRAKQESSLASHPDSRASTSEVNALQSGRRGAGNAPITPARKRRMSRDLNRTNSGIRKPAAPAIGSPLAARRPRSRGQSLSGRLDQTLSPGYSLKQQ